MTTLEDIERAIERLRPEQPTRLRAWFEAFEAARFEARTAQDAATGRLDALADKALPEF
ncbi:hypothetical protein [Blastochloris tepida]|uniref:Uncharacterized protein n=1 Tax=Blastochloris tepida TaxID=2233851 RepID=A0A348FYV0_9HYPH|nr:hypothetical protein [Blastochloris tepida]BBF92483.1 hypothetical protein BLTE_11680 [Blastochloris tepida]